MLKLPDKRILLSIGAGYALAAVLALALGFVAISAMQRLGATSESLYVHPFAVSNAALEARATALLMRNQVLQIALNGRAENIERLSAQVETLNEEIKKSLTVVREGFLGDRRRVDEVERLLAQWGTLRARAMALALRGEHEAAVALVTGENAAVVDGVFSNLDHIVLYARQRAADFSREGAQEAASTIRLSGVLLAGLVAVIALAGLIVVRVVALALRQKRQMEVGLRESEERWKFALEGAGEAVWDWNVASGDVLFSKRFGDMLGCPEHEVGSRVDDWQGRVHAEDLPRLRVAVQAHLDRATENLVSEYRMRCQDGSCKWILTRGMVVSRDSAGRALRMIGTHADVTERKHGEAALQESRAQFAGIIDSAMNAIITVDEAQRIVVFNAAAEAMFRIDAGLAMGTTIERFIPQRMRAAHGAQLAAFGAGGATRRAMGRPGRVRGLRADGEEFLAEAAISRVEVGGKRLYTVVLRDLTDTLAAEEERLRLEHELRQSQKLEALGTLAGGIAHDFNNILGAILGNAELARQDVGSGHPALASLEQIQDAGRRARSLVQQILVFSRRQPQQFQTVALARAVPECVKLLRATIPSGVVLECSTADAPLPVRADGAQIHQVMMNLCINAWHAIGERAGRIGIRLEEVMLDDALAASLPGLQGGPHARLSVSDDGCGMDEATRSHIFDPFFTTKPVGQGTGLGLAVVHGIVQAHGGAITVQSTPGVGTTFALYFPLVEATEAIAPSTCAVAATAGAGQCILYLDDDETMAFLSTRMLERGGYRVCTHRDARQALEAVRADPEAFDLVVTDFNMPGLSGVDVARELKRIRAQLPVVLISGYVADDMQLAARQAGVCQIVHKASAMEDLCAAVARTLRQAELGLVEARDDPAQDATGDPS